MGPQPTQARLCRCEHPLVDEGTCLRCGRSTSGIVGEPLFPPLRSAPSWTRTGVIRAIRAFAFFRGRPPVAKDWGRRMGRDWPPLETVEELFGSLAVAIDYACRRTSKAPAGQWR